MPTLKVCVGIISVPLNWDQSQLNNTFNNKFSTVTNLKTNSVNPYCVRGCVSLENIKSEVIDANDYALKCYATECLVYSKNEFESTTHWEQPKSIQKIVGYYLRYFSCTYSNLEELVLIYSIVNLPTLPNIKRLKLRNSQINFQTQQTPKVWGDLKNSLCPFPNVEQLELSNSSINKNGRMTLFVAPHLRRITIVQQTNHIIFKADLAEVVELLNSKNVVITTATPLKLIRIEGCECVNIEGDFSNRGVLVLNNVKNSHIPEICIPFIELKYCTNMKIKCKQLVSLKCENCNTCTIDVSFVDHPFKHYLELISCSFISIQGDLDYLEELLLKSCDSCMFTKISELQLFFVQNSSVIMLSQEIHAKEVVLDRVRDFIPIDFNSVQKLKLAHLEDIQFDTNLNGVVDLLIEDCKNVNATMSTLTQINASGMTITLQNQSK